MINERAVGLAIKSLSNLIGRQGHELCERYGVTKMQTWIIGYVYLNKDRAVYQRDIERKFNIRRSTASVLLSAMEKRGLIKRESIEKDARLKRIVLSQKALEIREAVDNSIKDTEKRIASGISDEEIDDFLKTIEKMKKNMEDTPGRSDI